MRHGLLIALLLACGDFGKFRHASVEQATTPTAPGRCSAETTLLWRESAPGEELVGKDPQDVKRVTYPAPPGELAAWILRPKGDGPFPTLVYFHGGFAWTPDTASTVRSWVEQGWLVFMPALRGENGNPGTYELLCGEIDDAAAAVTWIASQPDVDKTRIATFGHSLGGAVSATLSLRPDLPIAASGSAGGLYFEEVLQGWGPMLPFDPASADERRRRLFVAHLGEMKRPHTAWMGRDDALSAIAGPASERAAALGAPLQVIEVDGDHRTSLKPALDAFWTSEPLQKLARSGR